VKGEEEVVFRRIKEMKDSLLTRNYTEKGGRNPYNYWPRGGDLQDARPAHLGEHRVENIDKINTKIQQILSCLR
jgi:hypothetical protein